MPFKISFDFFRTMVNIAVAAIPDFSIREILMIVEFPIPAVYTAPPFQLMRLVIWTCAQKTVQHIFRFLP